MDFVTIFDMNGVLIDSHDLIWNGVNNLLGEYNVSLSPEDIKRYIGKSLEDDIKDWNSKYSLSLELKDFKVKLWEEQRDSLKKLGENKNLTTLLNELEANNISKGVGTSSNRFRAIKILDWSGLRNYFPVLVAAEDVHNHKPSPDTFLKVAQKLSTPPENCIVIEDSYSGILAAKIAKMKAIGYLGNHNSKEDLIDADLIIKDFSELSYQKLSSMFNKDFKPNTHAFSNPIYKYKRLN